MKSIIPRKNTKLPGGKPCKMGVSVDVSDEDAAKMVRNGWADYAVERDAPAAPKGAEPTPTTGGLTEENTPALVPEKVKGKPKK